MRISVVHATRLFFNARWDGRKISGKIWRITAVRRKLSRNDSKLCLTKNEYFFKNHFESIQDYCPEGVNYKLFRNSCQYNVMENVYKKALSSKPLENSYFQLFNQLEDILE